jgi:hypothetical protein
VVKNKINTSDLTAIEVYKLVLSGQLKTFPKHFWDKPDSLKEAKEITKYLFEDILKWNDEDIRENFNHKIFRDNKLSGMVMMIFKGSPYLTLNNAYPEKYYPWELSASSMFWNKETSIKAIKWLIEEKLQWNDEEIKIRLTYKVFESYNLAGMMIQLFNGSPFEAINLAYPNRFKPWELNMSPLKYWNIETAKDAMKWLMNDKLKWSKNEVKNKVNKRFFKDNNLGGMLAIVFNDSPYDAINTLYPNEFKPWELLNSTVPQNYWNKNTSKKSIIWLFDEKLKWSYKDIINNIHHDVFTNNGLQGMLQIMYKSSPYLALKDAYPNEDWSMIRSKFNPMN